MKRHIACLRIAGAVAALFIANIVVTPKLIGVSALESFFRPRLREAFDSARWRAASLESGQRYAMAGELLKSRRLAGARTNDIAAVLGPPDGTSQNPAKEWLYYLAPQKLFPSRSILFPAVFWNMDAWTLVIVIENGAATNMRIAAR